MIDVHMLSSLRLYQVGLSPIGYRVLSFNEETNISLESFKTRLQYPNKLHACRRTIFLRLFKDWRIANIPVDSKSRESRQCLTLIETRNAFCRKWIKQLSVLKDLRVIVCLSDGIVQLFDMDSYNLITNVTITKTAQRFDIYTSIELVNSLPVLISRLCISSKHHLYFYEWRDDSFVFVKEYFPREKIKCIKWCPNGKICVAAGREYFLYNPMNEDRKNICAIGKKPNIILISNNELLVFGENEATCVNFELDTFRNSNLGLQSPPDKRIDTIGDINFTIYKDTFYAYSEKDIYSFKTKPILSQIDELVELELFEEAISMLENYEKIPKENKKDTRKQFMNSHWVNRQLIKFFHCIPN
ncbi:hypothetical protein ROZALSC1DRAFT_23789 [Rozella allomycis CSF55]|uniref:WD40 repeat-like protein n=1 Tax=Rozella allomycis (strain CSF55) TaxID=988480 RepID=A0A4P9YF69_ROZAC|nr:hypothetical protein ROZALSC1DRAFT_23789 [Rozella allomycis CSF55]